MGRSYAKHDDRGRSLLCKVQDRSKSGTLPLGFRSIHIFCFYVLYSILALHVIGLFVLFFSVSVGLFSGNDTARAALTVAYLQNMYVTAYAPRAFGIDVP